MRGRNHCHFAARLKRIIERGIEIEQGRQAILCGEIIEEYPDDYPYLSCLLLGNGLHVVAGLGDGRLWLVTVYIPDPAKWSANLKTQKEVQA